MSTTPDPASNPPPAPATYDSRLDSLSHIARVKALLDLSALNLMNRGSVHDLSKLEEPEKSGYDQIVVKLKDIAYGTDEYKAALRGLKPTLDHHYAANRHHPEHFQNGIRDMTLLDLIEMLMDWKAASERMKGGGDIYASITHNIIRFNIEPQLAAILLNTAREMKWAKKDEVVP